ncbi:hypothetical protein [Vogesella sp. XCS3]|uniref:hypothetical protein n=1 Tax=Vogesella sp. XCS3 TaxID=2877939 RepID=UPI001D09C6F6|nr:hypothetical protein [Vogesella sp. XCS3]UDM15866.1 hypothetical protein LCH97_11160 [Vogesella sp. XCS3]
MAAHSNITETSQSTPLTDLSLPVVATISGSLTVRLIFQGGMPWVALRDLHAVLGYKSLQTGAVRRIFENYGYDFYSFTLRLPVGRNAALFINEAGLRLVCELLKPDRTHALKRWLDDGGLRAQLKTPNPPKVADAVALAPDEAECGVDAAFDGGMPKPNTPPNNVIPLVSPQHERRKQYCRELCRVLLRYASETETRDLTHLLEDVVADQLASRYSPGLNAAAYDVFARYGLKGGAL